MSDAHGTNEVVDEGVDDSACYWLSDLDEDGDEELEFWQRRCFDKLVIPFVVRIIVVPC